MYRMQIPVVSKILNVAVEMVEVKATSTNQAIRQALHIAGRERHIAAPMVLDLRAAREMFLAQYAKPMPNLNGHGKPFWKQADVPEYNEK